MNDVLIVEDESGVREFLRYALQRAGIPFRMAVNGKQALMLAGACWPGVVLLDLTLPGPMDGWQLWECLAELAMGRPLSVVVFAAELSAADRNQAMCRGAYGILRKPVSPDSLIAILLQVLEQS